MMIVATASVLLLVAAAPALAGWGPYDPLPPEDPYPFPANPHPSPNWPIHDGTMKAFGQGYGGAAQGRGAYNGPGIGDYVLDYLQYTYCHAYYLSLQ